MCVRVCTCVHACVPETDGDRGGLRGCPSQQTSVAPGWVRSTQGPRLREEPAHHINTGALLTAVDAVSMTPSTVQTPEQAVARSAVWSAPWPRSAQTFPGQRKAGEKPSHTAVDSVSRFSPGVLILHRSPPCA